MKTFYVFGRRTEDFRFVGFTKTPLMETVQQVVVKAGSTHSSRLSCSHLLSP